MHDDIKQIIELKVNHPEDYRKKLTNSRAKPVTILAMVVRIWCLEVNKFRSLNLFIEVISNLFFFAVTLQMGLSFIHRAGQRDKEKMGIGERGA